MEYEYERPKDEYQSDNTGYINEEENQDAILLRALLDSIKMGGGIPSDPVANENGVYFSCNDGYFYALTHSGNLKWKFLVGDVNGYPSIGINVIYFGSFDGHLYAVKEENGELLWKFKTGDRVLGEASLYPGRIYFGSTDNYLYCLTINGELLWKYKTNSMLFTSPTVVNDRVYFGGVDKNIYCLSKDGYLIWKFPTGGAIFSLIVIDEDNKEIRPDYRYFSEYSYIKSGYILFGSSDGTSYMLDLDGNLVWSKKTEKKLSIMTIHDDTIYAGSHENEFYALELMTGFTKWKLSVNSPVTCKPIVKDDILYLTSMENTVYVIDIKNKNVLKTFRANGPITSTIAILGNVIYVGSWDNTLYALDCKTLDILWKFSTGFASQKPRFFGIFKKFSDIRSKISRFWRPDPKQKDSIYEKEEKKQGFSFGPYNSDTPYSTKPTQYTITNQYDADSMRKKKKDERKF